MNFPFNNRLCAVLALGLLLSLIHLPLTAAFIQPGDAAKIAQTWLLDSPSGVSNGSAVAQVLQFRQGSFSAGASAYDKSDPDLPLVYLVSFADGAFVLMSADDNSIPVLGYSAEAFSQPQLLHSTFLDWVGYYELQIAQIIQSGLEIPENKDKWQELRNGRVDPGYKQNRAVQPLLASNWDQGWPYNELCPVDPQGPGGHVWAGCVATAMGMVMKYWNHPITGVGSNSYYASGYGYQSANFGATTYLWDEMPNAVGNSNLPIATLLYHCGVSVDMGYSPDGSGAQSSAAADALVDHFRYPNAALHSKNSYSDAAWNSLLTAQIDNASPMYYSGYGSGGHAFCVDGYDTANFFHFNFGWSGSYNGYYYVNNINPGGSYFSEFQSAIINSIPENYSMANARIRMRAVGATVGNNFNLAVSTYPILGSWNVDHYEFQLFYDHEHIVFNGASVSNTIAANGTLTVTETTPGFLNVNWDGTSNLFGAGDLINFTFMPLEAGEFLFDLGQMKFNTTPVTNTDYLMLEVLAPVATLAQSAISMLNVMHLGYYEIGTTEIRTTYLLPSWNVTHYEFDLAYDPAMLEFVGIDATGTISQGHSPQAVVNSPGSVSVSCDAGSSLTGDGILLKLNFRAIGNSVTIMVTQVTPSNFFYNDTLIASTGSANFILAAGTTEVQDEVTAVVPTLRIWPNPISGTANLSFSGKADIPAKLKVFNLKGQMVREIELQPGRELAWDVKDSAGARLASGIYFLAWQQDGYQGRSRILILK
ncbi:MAG: C10 family peptidase [Candidatus Syntrophosphaera sp.]|nr:C10 family peptidase [Candidatus Syntrophosphaera sp.]